MKDELGDCCGVRFIRRGEKDNHILIQLLTEDDENWIVSDYDISSYWIDDLIDVLTCSKKRLEIEANPDIENTRQYGWKFRVRSDDESIRQDA